MPSRIVAPSQLNALETDTFATGPSMHELSPQQEVQKPPRQDSTFKAAPAPSPVSGSYVPARILTNADLEKMVDTSDEWITSRTGIKERRIAAEDEFTSDLAAKARASAMEQRRHHRRAD